MFILKTNKQNITILNNYIIGILLEMKDKVQFQNPSLYLMALFPGGKPPVRSVCRRNKSDFLFFLTLRFHRKVLTYRPKCHCDWIVLTKEIYCKESTVTIVTAGHVTAVVFQFVFVVVIGYWRVGASVFEPRIRYVMVVPIDLSSSPHYMHRPINKAVVRHIHLGHWKLYIQVTKVTPARNASGRDNT